MPQAEPPSRKEARYGLAGLALIAFLLMLLWARGYFAADASTPPPTGHGSAHGSVVHTAGNGGHSVPDRHSHGGAPHSLPGNDIDYVTYRDGKPWIFHEPPKDPGVGPTSQDWFAGQPDEQSNSGPGFSPEWSHGSNPTEWSWGGGGGGAGGGGGGGGGNPPTDTPTDNGPGSNPPGSNPPADNPPVITNPGPDAPVSAVPEPAVWAMMLVGFGAVGFALRRGRKLSAATA
jgi:hypothetical protein